MGYNKRARNDYYRMKVENGKISIALFEKSNPIPHTKYKGKIDSKETQQFLKDIHEWIPDKEAKNFLKGFINYGEEYSKDMKEDFKDF